MACSRNVCNLQYRKDWNYYQPLYVICWPYVCLKWPWLNRTRLIDKLCCKLALKPTSTGRHMLRRWREPKYFNMNHITIHRRVLAPFTVITSFAQLLHFVPKLIFKTISDIFIVQIQKVLRMREFFLFLALVTWLPASASCPLTVLPRLLHIVLRDECSEEAAHGLSYHAAHRCVCFSHFLIDLGSTSMSEGSFLILLDDCVIFLCVSIS